MVNSIKMAPMKPSNPKNIVTLDEALAMTGYGMFNILIMLVSGSCLMCVIIETMCMSFIVPAAQCDLDLDLTQKGILSSISFIGVMFSSYLWGYIADTRGRRTVLVISLTVSFLTTLISSIIPWTWLLIILRFINGFFIGGTSSIVYAYTGEFHDNHYRPKIISWMCTFVALGNMYLPGLAWVILPGEWSFDIPVLDINFRPWRLLFIIYTLPCVSGAFLMYLLPESPKFLISQGRQTETLAVLRKMYVWNTKKPVESYEVMEITWDNLGATNVTQSDGVFRTMWKQTRPLFQRDLLGKTLIMCYMQFGIFASNSGVLMWFPEILNRMWHFILEKPDEEVYLCTAFFYEEKEANSTMTPGGCRDAVKPQVFMVSLIMAGAYAATYVFIGCFINIIGKKKLMIGFVTITTIAGVASQFIPGYELIQSFLGIFLMGGAAIGTTNAIAVDLFPTQVRGMALSTAMMFGRVGAMLGTNLVGPILHNVCNYLFYFIAADHIILIIVVLLLPSSPRLPKLNVSV